MSTRVKGYVVMDLETDGLFKETSPNITCGCTMRIVLDGDRFVHEEVKVWAPDDLSEMCFLSASKTADLVNYLADQTEDGFVTVGWNSLSFDTRVLHSVLSLRLTYLQSLPDNRKPVGKNGTGLPASAVDLEKLTYFCALERLENVVAQQIDPMFCIFMCRGYPVGLNAVAKGFGLPGKSGEGKDAIAMWLEGGPSGRAAVIEYCKNDIKVTAQVLESISKSKLLKWINKKDTLSYWKPHESKLLMPAKDAMRLPQPDNSRMDTPILKSQFVDWLSVYPALHSKATAQKKRKRR